MNYRKIIFILCMGIFLSSERSAYAQVVVNTYSYTGATQSWTVPAGVTSITVDVRGAQGGTNGSSGGLGARMQGVLTVTPSNVLTIWVGGQGVATDEAASGGGGSGIVYSGTPLVIAGGGGGASLVDGYAGLPGLTGTSGGSSSGPGGSGGNGGDKGYTMNDCGWAAGGGGFSGDGYGGSNNADGGPLPGTLAGLGAGRSAANGGAGGVGGGCGRSGGDAGGWGCGGGGEGDYGGGGGGGYSGGGGGQYTPTQSLSPGGGGGSYSTASSQTNTQGYQSGNGTVVISYNAFSANTDVVANVSCNGGSNGEVDVTLSGGCSSTFTYSWAPGGQTTDTISGLSAGIYSVTVYDSCGASTSATVTVAQPNVIATTPIVVNNVTCNGGSNGSASANISGGTSPYTYTWDDGQTTDIAAGLTAGTYSVVVGDSCGGTASATVTITEPNILTAANATINSNVSCFGGNNGNASVSLVGGGTPYTYSWTNGSTTNTAASLTAGTYTVSVTDACGATASAIATITQPATAVGITASVTTNVNCHGGNDGSASSSASGGTTAYTYLWTPSNQTNSTANNLTAGTYTVKVTDNNGCTATTSVVITQPIILSLSVNETANVSCNGGSNGSASSITGGGVYPYTYSWNNGGTLDTASGLSAGSYTLTVTDNHGCTTSAMVSITQPLMPLSVTANAVGNNTCYGDSAGNAISAGSGGTSPYSYMWTNGATTANINGLTAGDYTVTTTDNNGCTASAMITVTQPANPITLNPEVSSNVYCTGGNSGAAATSASGGFIPYTYSWSNGVTTDFVTGLTAGSYTVTVADKHGCSASAMIIITQPANALTLSATTLTNVQCYAGNEGSISSATAGGVMPYTYAWSNGKTTANTSDLTAGTYSVSVTDSNGCSATAMAIITQPTALVMSATITSGVTCNGSNTGSAISSVSGGTTPYTYAWSNGGTTATVNSLAAGNYSLMITDGNGCSTSASISITEPTALVATAHTIDDAGHNSGSAWVVTSGGATPYTYSWSPGGQVTDTIKGQPSGKYCCTITDGNGCKLDVCDSIMSDLGVASITSNGGQISVYPNPNNGQFTIQYSVTGENTVVEIYNVLGSEIYTSTFVSNKSGNTINISNQPAGIYLYRVVSSANGNLLGEGKIVLQK